MQQRRRAFQAEIHKCKKVLLPQSREIGVRRLQRLPTAKTKDIDRGQRDTVLRPGAQHPPRPTLFPAFWKSSESWSATVQKENHGRPHAQQLKSNIPPCTCTIKACQKQPRNIHPMRIYRPSRHRGSICAWHRPTPMCCGVYYHLIIILSLL